MRIRWRGLELPNQVRLDESVSTETYGRLVIEPFERGFGTTVGNGLRRILLSSLEGASVVKVEVKGVQHEFTSIPGVLEDVTDIVLNVKSLVVRLDASEPKTMKVERDEAGEVCAGDIEADPAITIINKGQVLATLTDDVEFGLEMTVESGRGYETAGERQVAEEEAGIIHVDALYSPVTRVRYKTEETRVGQRTNYDRLVMEIWTNGTVLPEMALVEAAKILRKHLNPFVQYFELGREVAMDEAPPAPVAAPALVEEEPEPPPIDPELVAKLSRTIHDLDLSVRAANCLESGKILTVADVVQLAEPDMLKFRSFGKTSLREVKRKLADMGLSLGMELAPAVLEAVEVGS